MKEKSNQAFLDLVKVKEMNNDKHLEKIYLLLALLL